LNPAAYHGHNKRPPFFEGWYYKLVSEDGRDRVAVIPAVILGEEGHAFIQILDGSEMKMDYHTFPLSSFHAAKKEFDIRISRNTFNLSGMHLNLEGDSGEASGEIYLEELAPWPVSLASPGVMGWYAWVPAMECYHGVLSFDHAVSGVLELNGRRIDFNRGRGYLEKDWGASFPEGYIWLQTNHFEQPGISLMASVAVIPWLGSAFPGFIIGLWLGNKLWRFATYTGAKLEKVAITGEAVQIVASDRQNRLMIEASRVEGVALKGPTKSKMGLRVDESLAGKAAVRLSRKGGEVLFEGTGLHTGLEVIRPENLLSWIGQIKK
jgi:hypothetical protein